MHRVDTDQAGAGPGHGLRQRPQVGEVADPPVLLRAEPVERRGDSPAAPPGAEVRRTEGPRRRHDQGHHARRALTDGHLQAVVALAAASSGSGSRRRRRSRLAIAPPVDHLEIVQDRRAAPAAAVLGRHASRPAGRPASPAGSRSRRAARRSRTTATGGRTSRQASASARSRLARSSASLATGTPIAASSARLVAAGHLVPPPPVVGEGRLDAVVRRQPVERAGLSHALVILFARRSRRCGGHGTGRAKVVASPAALPDPCPDDHAATARRP